MGFDKNVNREKEFTASICHFEVSRPLGCSVRCLFGIVANKATAAQAIHYSLASRS